MNTIKVPALILFLALTACDREPAPIPADAHTRASAEAAAPEWPQSQIDFIAIPADLKAAQAAASDDADRKRLRDEAPKTFCAKFDAMPGFSGWIGTIEDIRTSSVNKSIDFEVDVGGNISLEEVLQPADSLYATVAGLHVGDKVRLSGSFVHSASGSECVYYMGPFAVELTAVAPV